jgi:hypothetical protein
MTGMDDKVEAVVVIASVVFVDDITVNVVVVSVDCVILKLAKRNEH